MKSEGVAGVVVETEVEIEAVDVEVEVVGLWRSLQNSLKTNLNLKVVLPWGKSQEQNQKQKIQQSDRKPRKALGEIRGCVCTKRSQRPSE